MLYIITDFIDVSKKTRTFIFFVNMYHKSFLLNCQIMIQLNVINYSINGFLFKTQLNKLIFFGEKCFLVFILNGTIVFHILNVVYV